MHRLRYAGIASIVAALSLLGLASESVATHTVAFTGPPTVQADQAATFDASATAVDSRVYDYNWDFGDGYGGQGVTISHTFSQPSTYTVTLAVTDYFRDTAEATRTVTVSPAPREEATSGAVDARLFYEGDSFDTASNVRLEIWRDGALAYDQAVKVPCFQNICQPVPVGMYSRKSTVRVRDVNDDREPEVTLSLALGNICCRYTAIYSHRFGVGYKRLVHNWRSSDSGPLLDLDDDGQLEWRSGDGRIRYVFDCGGCAPYPIQIWAFDGSRLRDVTHHRRYRAEVARDARRIWKSYLRKRRHRTRVAGSLAAWVADQYSLGRRRKAWRVVTRAVARGELRKRGRFDGGPFGRRYVRVLRQWLRRTGYSR